MAEFKFRDEQWSGEEWKILLEKLIGDGLLSWKEVTTLSLGHLNPSQVGTSLASSEGFKLRYGKGNVMAKVMEWFYAQEGFCRDCGTRLELQADHNIPRESHTNPLDADYIENMVLRCRRCNVIKRPSHEFGGQTHLTAEAALMWLLFSFEPRTLLDFVRMCRIYGMTMADVRMQEGWAMAHWLQHVASSEYELDSNDRPCLILQWPDGGITRAWETDDVKNIDMATVLFEAFPNQHLVLVAAGARGEHETRVRAIRYRVGSLPFSHYFSDVGPEALAITYTPPQRRASVAGVEDGVATDQQVNEDVDSLDGQAPPSVDLTHSLTGGSRIKLLEPRGMRVLAADLFNENADVAVNWVQQGRPRRVPIPPLSRGKKLCYLSTEALEGLTFEITPY